MASVVSTALGRAGVEALTPSEFNWDGLFRETRRQRRILDFADMSTLGHACWSSSWLGAEDDGAAPARLRLVRAGWSLLSIAVAMWVLIVIWWLVAYGASRLPQTLPPLRVGLPWTSYLFPPVPPDLLAGTLGAARVALGFLSAAIALLAAVLAMLTWLLTPLPLLSALRVAAFQVLWFPIYALGSLPLMLGGVAALALGLGFVSTALNLKFTIQLPDATTWDIGPGWRELGGGVLAAAMVAALAAAAGWIAWRILEPIIDVVRYLGDRPLRQHIHRQFTAHVAELQASGIVIAAHSLGTVIAVDSLMTHPSLWSKFETIDLITAGSPLHRLLARFFPSAYPSVSDVAAVLARAYPNLRWANVYRPTDYVGGFLPASRIANHRIFRSAWRTHSNYWGDRYAIAWLLGQLGSARSIGGKPGGQSGLPEELDVDRRLRPPVVARHEMRWMVRSLAVLGGLGILWSQFVWTPQIEQRNLAEWQRLTAVEGVHVVTDAVAATAIDTATDQVSKDYDVVAFYYRVNGEVYGAESKVGGLPYATPRFPHVDWSRLSADVAASGQRRLPIEVVYAASSPRIFVVPKYAVRPSYYGPGRIFFYILRVAVLAGCWGAWCVGLKILLQNLAPDEREIRSSPAVYESRRV